MLWAKVSSESRLKPHKEVGAGRAGGRHEMRSVITNDGVMVVTGHTKAPHYQSFLDLTGGCIV